MNIEENKETPVVEKTEVNNVEEQLKNFETLVDQQQKQIDQLLKQNELNKKVNEQLNETLNNRLKEEEEKAKDPFQWVNDAINKNFKYGAVFDIQDNQDFSKGSPQLASWYMRYLSEVEKKSPAEIASRYERMCKELNTGIQAHENI